MNIFKRIGLFLSSFAPLFFLLIIKEVIEIINQNWSLNFLNSSLISILFFSLCYGLISFYIIIKEINTISDQEIIIKNKTNITDDHFLGYFSLFVLFAISFEIEMYSMACVFFIVLALIGIVYVKNDMYYINPLINILGFSFYDIEYTCANSPRVYKKRVFYKGQLCVDEKYFLKDKYSNFIFLTKKTSKRAKNICKK